MVNSFVNITTKIDGPIDSLNICIIINFNITTLQHDIAVWSGQLIIKYMVRYMFHWEIWNTQSEAEAEREKHIKRQKIET